MIDRLNDNAGAVQAISAVVLVLVTAVLVRVTAWYAGETRRIASSTAEQVNASREMAHASLRPVIEQWVIWEVPGSRNDLGEQLVKFEYWNVGNGPAVNVQWSLDPDSGRFRGTPRRVGMGARDEKGKLQAWIPLPLPDAFELVAVYEDAFGNTWSSRLQVVKDDAGTLGNGESRHRQII